jgi:nicotinamide mononucleotide transporter
MTDPVELSGFVLSLAMVFCNIKEIHWGWPLAIASSVLYGMVFWNSQLYGEASLQVMFVLTSLWGWRQWLTGKQTGLAQAHEPEASVPLKISRLLPSERQKALLTAMLAWPALTFFLYRFTDSQVAVWDALVTTLSLLAQYLLAKKKLENWWVWLVVNLLTIGLMLVKSLWLTAVLYLIFAVLSYVGLKAWQKHLQHERLA